MICVTFFKNSFAYCFRQFRFLCFVVTTYSSVNRNRKCNIIWSNPPQSKSLKTYIDKYFFRLRNKNFLPGHNFNKIFNKNTLKFNYSCIPNLKAKIDGHNKKIPENTPPPKAKLCNCLKKNWLLRGACLTENILYYARINCVKTKHRNRNCIKESAKLFFKKISPTDILEYKRQLYIMQPQLKKMQFEFARKIGNSR